MVATDRRDATAPAGTSSTTERRNGLDARVAVKPPVRVATTANITLDGEQTIDGIAVVSGDRVLVKDQTTGLENGIYVCQAGAWYRDIDFNGTSDVVTGTMVKVNLGSTLAGTLWTVTTTGTLTIGTTSLAFAQTQTTDVGAVLAATTAKTTPVDADTMPLNDSADSNLLKKITWANIKAAMFSSWGVLIAAGTGKTTPVDADTIVLSDSAAAAATKKLTWANIKATLKAYFDPIYATLASPTFTGTPSLPTGTTAVTQAASDNSTKLATTAYADAAVAATATALNMPVIAKTGAYTVVAGDAGKVIDCTTGTFTVTLTAAATLGDGFTTMIKNSGTGVITIDANGSETIDGQLTTALASQYDYVVLTCDGSNWIVVDQKRTFTSAEQTITAAGALTLPHGLVVKPTDVRAYLVCKTSEYNYSIGDEVEVNLTYQSYSTSVLNLGASCVLDATNINIRYGSNANVFIITNKTTGGGGSITLANWKLVVRVEA